MKPKNCLIFGASGQIGRNLIRKLTKNNYKVTAVTRNLHQKGYVLKTQANPGYIDIIQANIFDEDKIRKLMKEADICINLIGILYEKNITNSFINIHEKFPSFLSNLCNEYKLEQFIHLSAMGIEKAKDSFYAQSKLNGEINIEKNFSRSVILKPSIVYSVDDSFTTNFMTLLNRIPIFPLYYNGKTKFMPIYCSDLTEIIYQVIVQNIRPGKIECIGNETLTLKEILQKLLKLIGKKRLLFPMPLLLAKLTASFFQLFSKPLITLDQLRILKYDNIKSEKFKNNFDLNIPALSNFDSEVKKYSYMWTEAGQFSQDKYKK
ncbi:complex I NDUFA9 subunit family protein [Candidatus Pelagibacter sp.]|nr:complex I NDUFA9 subunit family protein [Candidatus Pelagibacter sp.]